MNFRIFQFVAMCGASISTIAMEHRVVTAKLMINTNCPKSAAYASEELIANINATTGIQAKPFGAVIPVRTGPTIIGMPSYLPLEELQHCKTGTVLPFIIEEQEVLLTCIDNPMSKISFEKQLSNYVETFNKEPELAFHESYRQEYPRLKQRLVEEGLIQSKPILTSNTFRLTHITHGTQFKPCATKKNTYKNRSRQYLGRKK